MKSPFCMKVCSKCGELLVANSINFTKMKTGKYGVKGYCKRCKRKQDSEYHQINKDKIAKRHMEYYQANPEIYFNNNQKRRQSEKFGPGLSKEEWLDMMKFFDWKCAYSGEPLTYDNRSIDHIVPLKRYGYNGILNMVPCTKSINSSKHTSDMIDWYKKQDYYSEDRLNKIYEWLEYSVNKYSEHIKIVM